MSVAVEQRQLAPATRQSIGTIAFDTWVLGGFARNQGVHAYAKNLLTWFRELAPLNGIQFMPYVCGNADTDANEFGESPGFSPREIRLLKFNRLWRFGGACALSACQRVDLVFSPHCTSLYFVKIAPAVMTIHDLIPIRVPWSSGRVNRIARFCLWSAARFSRAIITGSQNSKADLLNAYSIEESKVFVVHYGYDKSIFNAAAPNPALVQQLFSKLSITKPYIVHHGAIKPSKNLVRLIQAFRLLRQRNANLDLQLVLAGPSSGQHQDVTGEAHREPGVILTGALSEQDLGMLVKGASLAVIPSLYEGFCLPMVEAMACGVPTIAANRSCLPEISGGVLRYFNPESVDEMASSMEETLEDSELRMTLTARGTARARQFDWRLCAEQTLTVLKQVLLWEGSK